MMKMDPMKWQEKLLVLLPVQQIPIYQILMVFAKHATFILLISL